MNVGGVLGIVILLILGLWGSIILYRIDVNMIILRLF
jgi:hypothetical protein